MEHNNKFFSYNPYAVGSYLELDENSFKNSLDLCEEDYKSLVSSHFAYWSHTNVFVIDKSFLVKEGCSIQKHFTNFLEDNKFNRSVIIIKDLYIDCQLNFKHDLGCRLIFLNCSFSSIVTKNMQCNGGILDLLFYRCFWDIEGAFRFSNDTNKDMRITVYEPEFRELNFPPKNTDKGVKFIFDSNNPIFTRFNFKEKHSKCFSGDLSFYSFVIENLGNLSNLSIFKAGASKSTKVISSGIIDNLWIHDSRNVTIDICNICRNFDIHNTEFDKFSVANLKELKEIPSFDEKSKVKHSLDIDKVTFDNLLKIKNAGSIEFSQLAEFFNRNNAYMEAQQLHRHYLLAKAKESLKEDSKEDAKTNKNKSCFCKKWTGLSGLINIYDLINGCGTSFVKPIICMFFIWIANVVILQYQFIDDGIKVFCHSIDNILPFAGIFKDPEDICMPGVILALKVTSILATLLWFLIALQIRKLLKLKD